MIVVLGLLILAAAVYAVVRQAEVRLTLFLAALALALVAGAGRVEAALRETPGLPARDVLGTLAGPVMEVVKTFLKTFTEGKFILPICSAMGFAYVLRETKCDQHLIHLLVRPLRRVRPVLLPGVVAVAFLVNIPLISQTSTAVAVGTVMVPLLRAARLSPVTIGAALLLGASVGGELFNPGAPELHSVSTRVSATLGKEVTARDCVAHIGPLLMPGVAVATILFWLLNGRSRPEEETPNPEDKAVAEAEAHFRVNLIKAVVPFVPLTILFVVAPPLELIRLPREWFLDPKNPAEAATFDSRQIGAAMLVGVFCAALTARSTIGATAKVFFEGAGYAFTHIVALIVTATCLGKGVELIGLDSVVGRLIATDPTLLLLAAAVLGFVFALVSGSGMATTQSFFATPNLFVDPAIQAGLDPIDVGAVVSIAAAAGRTASPVAAVTLMCAALTETNPFHLSRRVIFPLACGVLTVWLTAAFVVR